MSTHSGMRMMLLIPRKQGISEDDFHRHWANIHGPLAKDL